jgi:alkylhydroperoxidase/carboxymuconolactone decarboxylase family protein YurZ
LKSFNQNIIDKGVNGMNEKVEKAIQLDKEGSDKLHRKIKEGLETIKAGGTPKPVEILGQNAWDRLFFKKMPDLEIDYFVNPFIHLAERGKIDPKTRALCLVTSYLSREPKDSHGITMWSIFAKQCGATEEEILECSAIGNITNGKVQMLSTEKVMTEVFNNPAFINAKDETK